ncbi:hypothetical protein [Marinobacter adhaerens]|uniref:hypothetical protein n=1 Tax=Marinobacter adhaerens TaxID=1033846 RepID=UPI003D2C3326
MTLEATITQLEQTNANLVNEVVAIKTTAQDNANTAVQKASEASQSADHSLAAKNAAEALYGDLQAVDAAKTTAVTKASESSDSAAAAMASEQAAASSEANASAILSAIQDAADLYDDTAAGIAGTVDGKHFRVVSEGGAVITLYKNVSGTATEITVFTSKTLEDNREAQLRADIAALVLNASETPVRSIFFTGATGAFIDASSEGA